MTTERKQTPEAELASLRAYKADQEDFMAFMTAELAGRPCACENGGGDHSSTPPMCWPELIDCIAKRAVRDEHDRLTTNL